jgi:hypothetical protein
MICPDCKGRKVIELALSTVNCELCAGEGEVTEVKVFDGDAGVNVPINVPASQAHTYQVEPSAASSDLPPAGSEDRVHRVGKAEAFGALYGGPLTDKVREFFAERGVSLTEKRDAIAERFLKSVSSDTGKAGNYDDFARDSYLGVSQGGEPAGVPRLEPGYLYQYRRGSSAYRCMGKELVCSVDGYSKRDNWVDLAFYRPDPRLCTPSVVRLDGDTEQHRACIAAISMANTRLYRLKSFLLGDRWQITVEGVREHGRPYPYGVEKPNFLHISAFYDQALGVPYTPDVNYGAVKLDPKNPRTP